ncbi:serine/threonine-protein kinase [Acrocarpospora catenulata]|uniref:serine/threonine-protein kinase n=1 Tax=Acrocarpospora catenulata TaxID=2836182 RepID=UPI001BD9B048|nr:serine/threonine-protein kinase [Acrocarpospora catenulata]
MGTDRARLLRERYRLATPVRRDGTGIMWQAHDLRLTRDVAIKEVRPRYRMDMPDLEVTRRRALKEARSAARLSHPGIITVHDLFEEKGRLWIVTEFLEGLTLKETIGHIGPLPVRWCAWLGFQLLASVQHAHFSGVLHGDIQPENVLLTGDRVVLTDFGIASMEDDGTTTTLPITRSAAYLAPERMRGGPATPAADLWSLGATLYTAVEGRPPFPGDGAMSMLGMALSREPDPPANAKTLWPVIEGLLRREAAHRLTGEAVSLLLADLLRREGISASTPGRRPQTLPSSHNLPPGAFTL